jgi:hypothetical protein
MSRARMTQAKRQRELQRAERGQEKAQTRAERKKQKDERVRVEGEDPDIAGIIPGPQPNPLDDDED